MPKMPLGNMSWQKACYGVESTHTYINLYEKTVKNFCTNMVYIIIS
jgi:hypothetical protein